MGTKSLDAFSLKRDSHPAKYLSILYPILNHAQKHFCSTSSLQDTSPGISDVCQKSLCKFPSIHWREGKGDNVCDLCLRF